jgi:hypothetical protein
MWYKYFGHSIVVYKNRVFLYMQTLQLGDSDMLYKFEFTPVKRQMRFASLATLIAYITLT